MAALAIALAVRRSDVRKRKHVTLKLPELTARTAVRSERANVSHPTLPGLVERVHHVLDRVEVLAREKKFGNEPVAARRRGDAARKFLHAWETLEAVLGGTMDFDRVRAAGIPGSPPIQALIEASDVLRQAQRALYPDHFRIIQHVVCRGMGVAQVAQMTAPFSMTNTHVEQTGFKMRDGLDRLADLWFSTVTDKAALRTYRPGESVPMAGVAGMIEPARTAHASRDKVRYSDE